MVAWVENGGCAATEAVQRQVRESEEERKKEGRKKGRTLKSVVRIEAGFKLSPDTTLPISLDTEVTTSNGLFPRPLGIRFVVIPFVC